MNYALAAGFTGLLALSYFSGFLPLLIPAWYLLTGLTAFLTYFRDKRAARREEWRVAEGTLHVMALAGGWPGALLAQRLFRHKTRKTPFRIVFWITVLANCGALAWLHMESAAADFRQLMQSLGNLVDGGVHTPWLNRSLSSLLSYR